VAATNKLDDSPERFGVADVVGVKGSGIYETHDERAGFVMDDLG